jgi:hypothetical protein
MRAVAGYVLSKGSIAFIECPTSQQIIGTHNPIEHGQSGP